MELETLTTKHFVEFNRFVAQHPQGSFLQSWDWGQWQEQLGQQVHRFLVKDNGTTLLAAQVIKTKIPRLQQFYLYIPYGPLLADHGRANVISFFLNELKKRFPQSLFIRVEPKDALPISGQPTLHIQPGKTLVLDLKQPPQQLLAAMHPKTRYNIRLAEKHGVTVSHEPIVTPGYGLHLQEALELIVRTAQRQKYKSRPASYYKNLIDFFNLQPQSDCHLAVYKAFLNHQLLATALMIDFGPTRTYLFGGTAEQSKNVMAPYALHWQAIIDAQAKQLSNYDFWGIETASGKTPGFVRFKLGWGGTAKEYPPAVDVVQRPAWYTIYNALRKLHRNLP